MNPRRLIAGVAAAGLLAAALVAWNAAAGEPDEPAIALVDGRPIYESAAQARIDSVGSLHGGDITETLGEEWRETILRTLIDDVIIAIEADRRGIEVASETLEQEMADVRRLAGGDDWEEWLESRGLDEEELERRIHLQLLSGLIYQAVTEGVSPTEDDLLAYYDENLSSFTTQDGERPFLEVRNSIEETVAKNMKDEAYAAWIVDERGDVTIEVVDDAWK